MARVTLDATKLIAVATIGLTLCGCSAFRQAIGAAKNPPDEFTVLTKAPLVIPPDFNLRPPQPGAAARNEPDPDIQAREALFPANAAAQAAALGTEYSEAEKFLLTRTNALAIDPQIRNRVTSDAGQENLGPEFANRLLNQPAGTPVPAQVQAAAPPAQPVQVQAAAPPAQPVQVQTAAPPAQPVQVQAAAPPAQQVQVQAAAPPAQPVQVQAAAPPAQPVQVQAAAPPAQPVQVQAVAPPVQPAPAPAARPDLAQPLPQPAGELALAGSATPQNGAVFDAPGRPGVRMMAPIPDRAPTPSPIPGGTPAASVPAVNAPAAAPSIQLPAVRAEAPAQPAVELASINPSSARALPPTVAASAAAPSGGVFVLQIGAYKTEQSAASALRTLNGRSQALSQLEQGLQVVDLGAEGTLYRLQAGRFADRPSAAIACEALKSEGVDCFVTDPTSSQSPASGQASLSPGG